MVAFILVGVAGGVCCKTESFLRDFVGDDDVDDVNDLTTIFRGVKLGDKTDFFLKESVLELGESTPR